MIKISTTLPVVALLAGLAISAPAFADTTPAGVASDVGSVQKDNADINQNNADLAKHRAEKAQDKAQGNWGSQAVDSMKIGADKTKRSVHKTGKDNDVDSLNSDVNGAKSQSSSNNQ